MRIYLLLLFTVALLSCKKNDPSPSSSNSTQSSDDQYYYMKIYLNGDSSVTYYTWYEIMDNGTFTEGTNLPQNVKMAYQRGEFQIQYHSDSLIDTLALKAAVGKSYAIDSVDGDYSDKFGLYLSLYNPANNTTLNPVSRQTSNVYKHVINSVKYAGFGVQGLTGYFYTVVGSATLLMYNPASPSQTYVVTVKYKGLYNYP